MIRLIKSWWKVFLTVFVILELILLIVGGFSSFIWQIIVLLVLIGLFMFIKYKAESDLKK